MLDLRRRLGAALSVGLFFLGRLPVRARQCNASTERDGYSSGSRLRCCPLPTSVAILKTLILAAGIQDEIITATVESRGPESDFVHFDANDSRASRENCATLPSSSEGPNILEGSIQKSDDQVRVNVQLINAMNERSPLGKHLRPEIDRHLRGGK